MFDSPHATAAPGVPNGTVPTVGGRRQWTRRLWLSVTAIALLAMLAGCSSIRLGYNNADTLLMYSLDSYFDLNDEQQRLARERVKTLLAWHRQTQLSQYARLIEDAQQRLDDGAKVSADDVLAMQDSVNQKMLRVADHAAPELARLALTLQPAQIDRFAAKLARDSAKARREDAKHGGHDSLDARVKRYAERSEQWFGSLTRDQLDLVRTALSENPSSHLWWAEERARRQRDIVQLLRRIHDEKPSEAVAAGWLRGYFAEMHMPSAEPRRTQVQQWRRQNAALMARLFSTATPQQKTVLARKLRGYADDLAALGAAPRG